MRERNYHQSCALARASDLLGERWTFLIIRDLLISPRRFSELENRLKGMGTNLLSRRLKDMQAVGLIMGGENRAPYALTGMGYSLEPAMLHLIRWSLRWIEVQSDGEDIHFLDWDLLALKSLFVPNPNIFEPLLAEFKVGDWQAWFRIDGTGCAFGLGEPDTIPDICFPCGINQLRAPHAITSKFSETMRSKAELFISCFQIG